MLRNRHYASKVAMLRNRRYASKVAMFKVWELFGVEDGAGQTNSKGYCGHVITYIYDAM